MDAYVIIALNGLALGLASTLHCAGMCSAISCSLLLAQEKGNPRASASNAFALIHAGRIMAYAAAGAVVAGVGAPAIAVLDRETAFRLVQWAGAVSMIWIGLSTAGLLPSPAVLDRGLLAISTAVTRAGHSLPRRQLVPLVSGMAWGMMPCAMVYAALFTAMITGSAAAGALSMTAFGIGTLPGLVAASFGFRRLAGVTSGNGQRVAAGLGIALFGLGTLLIAQPTAAYFCLTGQSAQSIDRHQFEPRTNALRLAPRTLAAHNIGNAQP